MQIRVNMWHHKAYGVILNIHLREQCSGCKQSAMTDSFSGISLAPRFNIVYCSLNYDYFWMVVSKLKKIMLIPFC